MIDSVTYNKIRNIIQKSVNLNNGYHLDDLIHDTIEKLLILKKPNDDCIKLSKKIALNLLRDHHRKCQKFKNIYDLEPEITVNDREAIKITPPKKYKEIYILRYKFGMKLREISKFTDTSINTIKLHHIKMKKELQELNL